MTFFHRSANANKVFKEKQMLLNLPCRKLKIDVVTRWNSVLDVLDRFLEQQPAISAALLSPEVRRSEKDLDRGGYNCGRGHRESSSADEKRNSGDVCREHSHTLCYCILMRCARVTVILLSLRNSNLPCMTT